MYYIAVLQDVATLLSNSTTIILLTLRKRVC